MNDAPYQPVISIYAYANRAVQYDMPLEACIRSWTPLAGERGEVVIATDPVFAERGEGTLALLNRLAKRIPQLRIVEFEWQLDEPGADGLAKAVAREAAADPPGDRPPPDILVPVDIDEILPEWSVNRAKQVAIEQITAGWEIVSFGMLHWCNGHHLNLDGCICKPYLTLADANLTHGIPLDKRKRMENGKIYCDPGDSDGAGLIYKDNLQAAGAQHVTAAPPQIRGRENTAAALLNRKDDAYAETLLDLDIYIESILNPNHIWVQHFSWYDHRQKWSMHPTWYYLWRNLAGDFPNGLKDYKAFDDGNPADFWDMTQKLPPSRTIRDDIVKEMLKSDSRIRLDWMKYPAVMNAWLNSPRRNVWYGRKSNGKQAHIPKPGLRYKLRRWYSRRRIPKYDF